MSDHLPECLSVNFQPDESPDDCTICAALRACEARVRASEFPLGVAVGKHDGFLEGYAAALDAAWDAVAASPHWYSGLLDMEVVKRDDALAAIDKLRGEHA